VSDRRTRKETATPGNATGETEAKPENAPAIRGEDTDLARDLNKDLDKDLKTDLAELLQIDDATLNILISSGC
jgi:hypothetical protein